MKSLTQRKQRGAEAAEAEAKKVSRKDARTPRKKMVACAGCEHRPPTTDHHFPTRADL